MDLIDLYTREVGRDLPEKTRADIEKEIRSLIEDSLEDESQKAGRPVDEEMQVEVLKRLGPPEKVAASYLPPRYLIGPELFPQFMTTLRIVLSIVTVVAAVGIGLSLAVGNNPAESILDVFVRVYAGLLDAVLGAAGMVVLIFAIIQYTSPSFKAADKEKDWDPRKLLSEPDPERVSVPNTISTIVSTFFVLVIFNLYPQWVGIFSLTENGMVSVPLFSEAFFRYLPWLSMLWVLEIAFNLLLVAQGKWTSSLRWFQIGLSLLTVALLAWMLSGPALVAIQAADLTRLGWNLTQEMATGISEGLQLSVRVTLGIIAAFEVIEMGKQLFKLFRQRLPGAVILSK